ncbi:hypothetical protein [Burkholderia stagnalis]|nr:hypothetical protein [Burkholderia stagnalis]
MQTFLDLVRAEPNRWIRHREMVSLRVICRRPAGVQAATIGRASRSYRQAPQAACGDESRHGVIQTIARRAVDLARAQLLDAIDAALAAVVAGVEAEADDDGFTPLERMRGQLAFVILFTRHDELRQLTQVQWRWLSDAGVLT